MLNKPQKYHKVKSITQTFDFVIFIQHSLLHKHSLVNVQFK